MDEEKKILTDVDPQKLKKMDEVFDTTSLSILNEVAKIVGKDLTNEEKERLGISLKSYYVLTFMMMKIVCT